MMSKKFLILFVLGLCALVVSCGPTQEEMDSTATQFTANIFTTQTAEAPTITLTPLPTSTPIAPTNTPIPPTATPSIVEVLANQITGDFDYFIMALSWSPDFCASTNNLDPQQCSIGMKRAFVLHGLWPTHYQGYPSFCGTESMSDELIDEFPGLFPNDFLYGHEWEKHGTCTGLDPEGYFLFSQHLKEAVIIPAAFESPEEPFRIDADGLQEAFVQINPTFSKNSFVPFCSGSGRFMSEVFVCLSKDGRPTECSPELLGNSSKSCGQPDFLVRNIR